MSLKGCFSPAVHRFAHAISGDVAPWMRHQPLSPLLGSSLLNEVHEVCDAHRSVLLGSCKCCWWVGAVASG